MLSSLLQKLLFINKFSISNGKIEIFDNQYIMLDANSLLALQEIDKTKVYKSAKDASRQELKRLVTHASVYKNIKNSSLKNIADLSNKIGKTDEGMIKTLQSLFEIYGLGKLQITELDNDRQKVSLKIHNSTMGTISLKNSKSKEPVCSLTAGVIAGIFSYIFKKDVDCFETRCIAQGNQLCEFEVY